MAANIRLSAVVLLFTVSGELAVIKAFAVLPAHCPLIFNMDIVLVFDLARE